MKNFLFSNTFAIIAGCIGSGLLFLMRGAFLPYFFPIYEELTNLNYSEITILLNLFILIQALSSPLLGYLIGIIPRYIQAIIAILLHSSGLLIIIYTQTFWPNIFGCIFLSIAFTLSKIGFNVVIINKTDKDKIRRVVSYRSVLVNSGSFLGNVIASYIGIKFGYEIHVFFLSTIMFLSWILITMYKDNTHFRKKSNINLKVSIRELLRDKFFISDMIKAVAVYLPYGCWGTIIPKYLIDLYGTVTIVPLVYTVSFLTTIFCTHFFNEFFVKYLNKFGITRHYWFIITLLLYIIGLYMFTFSINKIVLCLAVFIFILGEISMVPIFDEIVKSKNKNFSGFYVGIIQITDAFGRVMGSAISLSLYGFISSSHFWIILSIIFLFLSSMMITIAYFIHKIKS